MLCIAMVVGPLRLAWEGGTVVTLWSHGCHAVVMLCNTVVTLLLHRCHRVLHTAAKLLLRRCYTVVTLMLHCCDTVAVLFFHSSYTVGILLSGSSRRLLLAVGLFPVIAWVVGAIISVSGLLRGHSSHSALHSISLACIRLSIFG
jgi:hypothetical protein